MKTFAGLVLSALFFAAAPSAATAANEPANVRVRVQGDVHVSPKETVATAVSIMGTVTVDGSVTGNAVALFGDVVLGPRSFVGGDAISVAGRVRRSEGSRLGGREIAIESPARQLGKVVMVGLPVLAGILALVGAVMVLASTIGFLVLVVAILVLFERQVAAARQTMVDDPFRTFLIGFLVFLGTIPLTVFLAATLVGFPLAMAAVAVVFAAICLGTVAVCEWVGSEIARRFRRPLKSVWAGLLGLAVVFLLGMVPWVGTAVHVVVVLLGLGAVTQTRFRANPPASRV